MIMFSRCSDCDTCKSHFLGGCLAGHGDDDYEYASPEWLAENAELIGRLDRKRREFYQKAMERYNTKEPKNE